MQSFFWESFPDLGGLDPKNQRILIIIELYAPIRIAYVLVK